MICFIPAAGYGKRMGSLTIDLPKPLLKLGSTTLLDNTINLAKSWGAEKIVINTHYLAEKIHNHIEKIKDIEIIVSHEKERILGTAGGIKTALYDHLNEDDYLICMNPDVIYETNINIIESINNYNGKCLLFLYEKGNEDSYTSLTLDSGKVYFTKGNYMFTGMSIIHFSIFNNIKTNEYFDLADIFRSLASNNDLDGQIFPGKFYDIGDAKKYNEYLKSKDY